MNEFTQKAARYNMVECAAAILDCQETLKKRHDYADAYNQKLRAEIDAMGARMTALAKKAAK
jgi:prefoldin subunit 5